MKTSKLAGLYALLAIALLGSACTPAPAPTPTIDPNMLYTSAAQTVIAQLTQNAPPPTATLAATATQAPTATLIALPTLPPIGTLAPLSTPTTALAATNDKCQYITQSPADYSTVTGGSTFNIAWRIKNTGTTTWNTNYVYRFYAAANKLKIANSSYPLTASVQPNGEVELKASATASTTAGQYDAQWVLTNPEGTNFCVFSIIVNVSAGSSGGEATKKPPAEAEIITISEDDIDVGGGTTAGDHSWTTSHVNYSGSTEPRQIRIVYSINKDVPTTSYVTVTGNNSVSDSAKQYGSNGTGTLGVPFEHSGSYPITIEKNGDANARVYRVEVCVSTVNCW